MSKLLMITGLGSGRDLAQGKRGAFYQTLEEFHRYWERIDIIVPRVKGPVVRELFGNVFLHISPYPLWLHPWWFLREAKRIYQQQKFDLMTVQEHAPFYNGIAARLLWRKLKAPYVLELMHIPGHPRAGNLKEWCYKILAHWFIAWDASRARAVRVINKAETPNFLLASGVKAEQLIYIPSFYIDLGIFRPLDLPKCYDLIFVGRLAVNKGIKLFLEAVRQLPEITAVIVGNGPWQEKIKSYLKKYQMDKRVKLAGWIKDVGTVAELINQSKLLVMPSDNEGGPRVVLEAMACGVPVLATPVGIVPDVVTAQTGVVIDWKASAIASAADQLLKDGQRYEKYRANGLELVQQFSRSPAIRNYAERLKELI